MTVRIACALSAGTGSIAKSLRMERNVTFIMATHDASIAARTPRVLQLADGQFAE
jgi:predicted ABC-type transport system involved in lysophospholipase L1 biosynthesis ATPase subunit